MKKLLLTLAAAVVMLVFCCGSALAAVTIELDGHAIPGDVAPLLQNGRTLVPLRTVSQALGATVMWKDNEASIKTADGEKMYFTPGSKTAVLLSAGGEKQEVALDSPAVMRSGRVMVPLRVIAETFNVKTDYQNGQVILSSTPVYVDGKALNSMTTHQYMTMGGWVIGFYGNANVGRLYNALVAMEREEVAAPERYSRMVLPDEPYFYLSSEYDFYCGEPKLENGDETNGLVSFDIYLAVTNNWPEEEIGIYRGWLLHDVTADKWYKIEREDYDALGKLKGQLYPEGSPLFEQLLNNVV